MVKLVFDKFYPRGDGFDLVDNENQEMVVTFLVCVGVRGVLLLLLLLCIVIYSYDLCFVCL